jgi:hypothetical protein
MSHLAAQSFHGQDAVELPVLRAGPASSAQCADSARDAPPDGFLLRYVQDPFKDGYPFSYDLNDIAAYYLGYRRLMDHCRQSMPGVFYDVSYEQLVRDPENENRRLLAACELEWQHECLEFHRNPTATTTASASQVRRPIYDSSLIQWRHYETQLEGLRAQLLAAGIDATELSAQ